MDDLPSSDSTPVSRMIKGRGAASNPEGRFESIRHHAEDDGWSRELLDEDRPRPRTEVTEERARSVISRNDSPDIHFSQAINPYRGCEHVIRTHEKSVDRQLLFKSLADCYWWE
jgi:hypothetical protein